MGRGTEEEEEKEKKEKEKEKEDNKIGVAEKSFHYCHAWCRFVIAILGLAKGVGLGHSKRILACMHSCMYVRSYMCVQM